MFHEHTFFIRFVPKKSKQNVSCIRAAIQEFGILNSAKVKVTVGQVLSPKMPRYRIGL